MPPDPTLETAYLPEHDRMAYRLGRHIEHDPAILAYAAAGWPWRHIHDVQWTRRCPVLDQGALGSCTGHTAAGWLGTDTSQRQGRADVDEDLAVELYSAATRLDRFPGTYPPDDTGSSGLAAAKALRQARYCVRYTHAFSLRAALTALQHGPIMVCMGWTESMYDPDPDGRVHPSGPDVGGHEIPADELAGDEIWFTNSWGILWGVAGRFYLTRGDFAERMRNRGDITVPIAA